MSTQEPCSYADLVRTHEQRLTEVSPVPVNVWRICKALLYVTILVAVSGLHLSFNADPTIVGVVTVAGAIVILVGEVKEIEIANWITITFKNGGTQDDET